MDHVISTEILRALKLDSDSPRDARLGKKGSSHLKALSISVYDNQLLKLPLTNHNSIIKGLKCD